MRTLRAKIALLLVGSIIAVVVLITTTMMYAFRTPTDAVVELFARQLITMERLAAQAPAPEGLSPHPYDGRPDADQTRVLRDASVRLGAPLDLTVAYNRSDSRIRVASVKLGPERWLLVDFDPPSDPQLWGWFALITIGVGLIAVLAANRMSRPLALLESAVEAVTPDGVLPELAERGPAEVRATAAAINSLSARLKRAMESRMRLVAAAGHDMRTPLTRMRLRAEFVSDDEDRGLWLKDIDELQRIAHSAIQLVREETTRTSRELIRVDELVHSIATDLKEQGFAIEVDGTCEAHVHANRLGLSRALRNLLINSATHGVRGVVSVTGGAATRITIRDDGEGIAPDLLEQVFEPFFRADKARSQAIPGAGLGLTISREIIRQAGGDITIANGEQRGLVQIIELPSVSRAPADADMS
ncbi:two-component sensor histidine kinase [Azorhizobium oxalatiphilum]|uniref:histidine kinase n=1 Tax=Azorhizobium oxalatiphilum TaxID=980631 RepID=A0A917FEI8_9HYPH|nr:ATP-binding protein [Azorhizobium oxalatiphilum]GGF71838.1 two-component sensor histidine kinase [Azorhizobium oxalatiphilum]